MVDSDDDEDGSAPTASDGGMGSSFLRLIRESLKPHAGQDTPAGMAELGFSVLDELTQASGSGEASGSSPPTEEGEEADTASFVEHARSSLHGHRQLEERRREMHAG